MHTVVGLAKRDAGQEVGDEARVYGVEAVEEPGEPRLCSGCGLGVQMLRRTSEDVIEAAGPDLDVILVHRAVGVAGGGGGHRGGSRLALGLHLDLSRNRHYREDVIEAKT